MAGLLLMNVLRVLGQMFLVLTLMFGRMVAWFEMMFLVFAVVVLGCLRLLLVLAGLAGLGGLWNCSRRIGIAGTRDPGSIFRRKTPCKLCKGLNFGSSCYPTSF